MGYGVNGKCTGVRVEDDGVNPGLDRKGDRVRIRAAEGSDVSFVVRYRGRGPIRGRVPVAAYGIKVPGCTPGEDHGGPGREERSEEQGFHSSIPAEIGDQFKLIPGKGRAGTTSWCDGVRSNAVMLL